MKSAHRQVKTADYFARHPVFSLDEAARDLAPPGGRAGTKERLRHHLETGRLKLIERGLYAVAPPGAAPDAVRPDPFLVAAASRSDAVFCHHAALQLLGAAHSTWRECTVFTERRRRPVVLDGVRVRFLQPPASMRVGVARPFATRTVERRDRLLLTTGPERTLVEGFRRPALAGGLEELVLSASGFPTLDLGLLEQVLARYGVAQLWASTGWFLERLQRTFHVPENTLERWAREVPASPQYMQRSLRGGTFHRRWNLVVPSVLESLGGPDDR